MTLTTIICIALIVSVAQAVKKEEPLTVAKATWLCLKEQNVTRLHGVGSLNLDVQNKAYLCMFKKMDWLKKDETVNLKKFKNYARKNKYMKLVFKKCHNKAKHAMQFIDCMDTVLEVMDKKSKQADEIEAMKNKAEGICINYDINNFQRFNDMEYVREFYRCMFKHMNWADDTEINLPKFKKDTINDPEALPLIAGCSEIKGVDSFFDCLGTLYTHSKAESTPKPIP